MLEFLLNVGWQRLTDAHSCQLLFAISRGLSSDRSDTRIDLLVLLLPLGTLKIRMGVFVRALHGIFLRVYCLQDLENLFDLRVFLRLIV